MHLINRNLYTKAGKLLFFAFTISITMLSSCSDDEGNLEPTTISFNEESFTIAENNSNGVEVKIDFNQTALVEGDFSINVTSDIGAYGTDFTTDPGAEDGVVNFDVRVAENGKSIKVLPKADGTFGGDMTVTLTLSGGSNVNVGQPSVATILITDTESEPSTIADIRSSYTGTDITINENVIIEGVVTSSSEAMGNTQFVVQDETGGLLIKTSGSHNFNSGNVVRVNLFNGDLSSEQGHLLISGLNAENLSLINSNGNLPDYQSITLDQLNAGTHQGLLVSVDNVTFYEADGIVAFSGNKTISDGAVEALVVTESFATFAADTLPLGAGNIKGIAGVGKLWPQSRADVFEDNPTAFINIEGGFTTFEALPGEFSEPQTIAVGGASLSSDVKITAPDGFETSLDNVTYTSTTTIPLADVLAGAVTIYVRFAPSSQDSGAKEGKLAIISTGAAPEFIDIAGNIL